MYEDIEDQSERCSGSVAPNYEGRLLIGLGFFVWGWSANCAGYKSHDWSQLSSRSGPTLLLGKGNGLSPNFINGSEYLSFGCQQLVEDNVEVSAPVDSRAACFRCDCPGCQTVIITLTPGFHWHREN